eukprot:1109768-Rhodomonas_salina.1
MVEQVSRVANPSLPKLLRRDGPERVSAPSWEAMEVQSNAGTSEPGLMRMRSPSTWAPSSVMESGISISRRGLVTLSRLLQTADTPSASME